MSKLNKNNFLRWNGAFTKRTFTLTPVNSTWHLYANQDYTVIQPLASCSASLGINPLSFKILRIIDIFGNEITLSRDCYWDGISNLTVYRPIDLSLTDIILNFSFEDNSENICLSTGTIVDIIVDAINVGWVAYPTSAYCVLDNFGNNTGYLAWTQLQLINLGTSTPISPLTLKLNNPGDPDYLAPTTDYITCPVVGVGDYSSLFISNFSKNGSDPSNYIVITNIYLASTNLGVGSTPIALNIPCSISPGQTQRFNVPSGNWDTGLTISYSVTGNMVTASPQRYWLANVAGVVSGWASGGLTSNPVDNSGVYGNFTITIPSSSSGITIFAQ